MVVDTETFTDLAVHLKLASDAVLKTARLLSVVSDSSSGREEEWQSTLQTMVELNNEISYMEQLLRAVMSANREEPAVRKVQ